MASIFDEARSIRGMINMRGLTQSEIAGMLGVSQSYIANKLRLLRFSQEEQSIMLQNKLSERHARALLRISDVKKREEILSTIINEQLNVAQTEILVDKSLSMAQPKLQKQQGEPRQYKDTDSFYFAINRALEQAKSSNLDIKTRKVVSDTFTEITIVIPTITEQQ